jgi:hypothetical protein
MTPILPLRVRLVEGDQASAGFTPDTQEILRNRDFDGDHTLTSKLTGEMKTIAPLLYNYMFSPYNVHSKLTNYLTIKEGSTKRTKGRNYAIKDNARIFMLGVQNEGIKKASIELDKILTKYSDIPKLTEEAWAEINTVYEDMISSIKQDKDYPQLMLSLGYVISENPAEFTDDEVKFFNKVKELLGVKEVYKNKSDTKRFVNNPYLYAKNIDGYETYTYSSRLGSFARQLLEKTNTGDPRIGYYQKILSALPINSRVINNPLLDLYTPNIYMTDTLEAKINNIVKSRKSYEDYLSNLEDYLKQEVTNDKYTKGFVKEYDDYLKDTFKNYSIVEEGVDL